MSTPSRLTFAEALTLEYGDYLHDRSNSNSDGSPRRWKVSGRVQTWKRDPSRIRIPLKHGLRSYDALTEADFDSAGLCVHDLAKGYGA